MAHYFTEKSPAEMYLQGPTLQGDGPHWCILSPWPFFISSPALLSHGLTCSAHPLCSSQTSQSSVQMQAKPLKAKHSPLIQTHLEGLYDMSSPMQWQPVLCCPVISPLRYCHTKSSGSMLRSQACLLLSVPHFPTSSVLQVPSLIAPEYR